MRKIVVCESGPGCWTAEVPSLPGCEVGGSSRDQVIERIQDAVADYLDDLERRGEPVPQVFGLFVVDAADG